MPHARSGVIQLSLDTARILSVIKQGLHRRPMAADKRALRDTILRIGVVQLDTISVVARSHYLVMLARVGPYDPGDLDALLYPDRSVFEQWAHAACLIPAEDYSHFAPVMLARRHRPLQPWLVRRLGDEGEEVLDAVLAEVRERGPLASRDFEDPRQERGTWWDWKPAKTALEVLFERGYLMVDRRVNFQRYSDLAERVLPASTQPSTSTVADWQRFAALRSVACLGVATARHVSEYYYQKKPGARAAVESLAAEGAVVPVGVEGWKDTAYVVPVDLPLIEEIDARRAQPALTAFLSPFNNLIWDRQRVRDLFGFDYASEMYQPAAKRVHGYYVMPILHQGRLVGRLDPKVDRKTNTMIIRAIYLEPGQALTDDLAAGISGALSELMSFHSSEQLTIERSEPEGLRAFLLERLSSGT
jgi:uncharacterized protein YcaQ